MASARLRRQRLAGAGLALALGLALSHARAQDAATPVDWPARFAEARTRGGFDALAEELARAVARSSDPVAQRLLVDASLEALFELAASNAPFERRRAAAERARAAAERYGPGPADLARVDDAWATELELHGDAAQAEALLHATLERSRDLADLRPFLLRHLAQIATNRGDAGEAERRLAEATEALAASGLAAPDLAALRVELAADRAHVDVELGLIDRAWLRLELAAEAAAALDPAHPARVRLTLTQASVANAAEDFGRVEQLLDDALLERLRAIDPAYYAGALVRRGVAASERERETGKELGARALLEQALALDGVADDEARSCELVLADLALRAREARECATWLERARSHASPPPEVRARLAAFASALALLEQAGPDELRARESELGAALAEVAERWRSTPARGGGIGLLHFGTRRLALSEWVRLQLALGSGDAAVERALQPLLEAQELGTLARSLDARAELADVRRELLAPGRGALVFLSAMDRSHVFAVDVERAVHAELPSRDQLVRAADALAAAWTPEPPSDAREAAQRIERIASAARALADRLLPAEVRARIASWSSCVVVGADTIGSPALELLALEGERPLGIERSLTYVPGLPTGVALAARAARASSAFETELALIAAPVPSPLARERYAQAREIPWSDGDGERLVAAFGAGACELWPRERATRDALGHPRAQRAAVLSILAHGAYDPLGRDDGGRPAALILAPRADGDDGILWCSDVEQLAVAPLVELLACSAARGPARLGDDCAAHLVGAFLAAGANCVIASRTDVGRRAALELACELHARLRTHGDSPAEALRRARESLASRPETADPWHWAALAAYGAAWRPVFAARAPREAPAPRRESHAALIAIGSAALAIAIAAVAAARVRRAR